MALEWVRREPDYPPERAALVEFRLTYEGPLYGNKHTRPAHKHAIRREFHKQLARLWEVHPMLGRTKNCTLKVPGWILMGHATSDEILNRFMGGIARQGHTIAGHPAHFLRTYPGTEWHAIGGIGLRDYLAEKYKMNDFRFVPLVREELNLVVSLHVLFLRPGRPGAVVTSAGDIDGRIQTLFDALSIPKVGQLKPDEKPEADEDPFYCLVEDDKHITGVSVETDTLLQPTAKSTDHPDNDARLVITVKLQPYEHHPGNEGF